MWVEAKQVCSDDRGHFWREEVNEASFPVARWPRSLACTLPRDLTTICRHKLIEVLFERPYCKAAFLVNRGIVRRQTAAEHLKALTEAGFLESAKMGREMYYINTDFMALLQDKAAAGGSDL